MVLSRYVASPTCASYHHLILAQQAWYRCVLEIVEEFPPSTRQHWRDIAVNLRMPYFDWARNLPQNVPTVPTLLRDKTMPVRTPRGDMTIENPLYSAKFGASMPPEMGGTPWNNFPETLRRPVGNPTRSNNNEMNGRFDTMRISLRDRVFALFASKAPVGAATTAAIGVRTDMSGSGVDSYEAIHDVVHNLAGGESGGYMYYLDIAAHDPLFYLHHFNIDRLTHMHQMIVPNTWILSGPVSHPMAQWQQNEMKNKYSPLKPFTKDIAGNYFTSVDVIETRTLGYYYPETSDRSYQQTVRAINQLYGTNGRTLSKRDGDYTPSGQYLGRPIKEGEYHTVLSVIASKYAIAGSYTIHCFVGKPDNSTSKSTSNSTAPYPVHNSTLSASISVGGLNISASIGSTTPVYGSYTSEVMSDPDDAPYDPSTDPTQAPNFVGSFGVLGGMMAGGGNASQPVMTKGSIPLTTCLQGKVASGELQSLTPEHIEAYLQENLYYKVITQDGEVDADSIPHLHISVACTKAKPAASDDELPDLSAPYKVLPKATAHLPAGKPFTYVPSAMDIILPEDQGYDLPSSDGTTPNPSHGVFPKPAMMPWQESGYCYSQQTIEYVDEGGNFLYRRMGSGGN